MRGHRRCDSASRIASASSRTSATRSVVRRVSFLSLPTVHTIRRTRGSDSQRSGSRPPCLRCSPRLRRGPTPRCPTTSAARSPHCFTTRATGARRARWPGSSSGCRGGHTRSCGGRPRERPMRRGGTEPGHRGRLPLCIPIPTGCRSRRASTGPRRHERGCRCMCHTPEHQQNLRWRRRDGRPR